MPEDPIFKLREATRGHIRSVWARSGLSQPVLNDEDRVLLAVMQMHPEYYELWAKLDQVSDEEIERDGTNPILHIMIHHTLENQLTLAQPPEVVKTMERLLKRGKSRHEALHEIGGALTQELFDILKYDRPFNQRRYLRNLRRLR